MRTIETTPFISTGRLLLTTTLMFLAGIVAWWSWTQTGQGGLRYALIGAIIVLAAVSFFGRWKMYANNRK